MFGRKKVAMLLAEFFGSMVLTMVILGVAKSAIGIPYFVAIAAGLTLGAMVLVVGNLSGAHINPVVTAGLWTLRKIQTAQAFAYIAVQFLGALAAWALYEYLLGDSLSSITSEFKLSVLVAEAVGAFIFAFGVASAVYQRFEGSKLATVIGVSYLLGIIVASAGSNGFLNPAVALGVQSWSWAYAAGPVIGAVVGMNVYSLVFADAEKSTSRKTTKKKKK